MEGAKPSIETLAALLKDLLALGQNARDRLIRAWRTFWDASDRETPAERKARIKREVEEILALPDPDEAPCLPPNLVMDDNPVLAALDQRLMDLDAPLSQANRSYQEKLLELAGRAGAPDPAGLEAELRAWYASRQA
jgi:hypothetical protein